MASGFASTLLCFEHFNDSSAWLPPGTATAFPREDSLLFPAGSVRVDMVLGVGSARGKAATLWSPTMWASKGLRHACITPSQLYFIDEKSQTLYTLMNLDKRLDTCLQHADQGARIAPFQKGPYYPFC